MTPRKELYITIKKVLNMIPQLEYIDLDRGQMQDNRYPNLYVSALIGIGSIRWETMTEQQQEGQCEVEITLYCRDGWRNQFSGTQDQEDGLMEIDLLDSIAHELQFLKGESFLPMQQTSDEVIHQTGDGIFAYRQNFSTRIYRRLQPKYQPKKMNL